MPNSSGNAPTISSRRPLTRRRVSTPTLGNNRASDEVSLRRKAHAPDPNAMRRQPPLSPPGKGSNAEPAPPFVAVAVQAYPAAPSTRCTRWRSADGEESGPEATLEAIGRNSHRREIASIACPRSPSRRPSPCLDEPCAVAGPYVPGMSSQPDEVLTAQEFSDLVSELSNWNRWGPEDQRGALHFLTAERIAAATGLVQDGLAVSLSLPLNTISRDPQPCAGGPLHDARRPGLTAAKSRWSS